MDTPAGGPTGPEIVLVASDRNVFATEISIFDRLRRSLYALRETAGWQGEITVIDVGLQPEQRRALVNDGGIRVFDNQQEPRATVLHHPAMWKMWADKYSRGDPLIVMDADVEVAGPATVERWLDICGAGRGFVCEEIQTWHAALHPLQEVMSAEPETSLCYAEELLPMLANHRVLNSGLIGGPRWLMERLLARVRVLLPTIYRVFRYFWDQIAVSYWVRQPEYMEHFEILPAEDNWLIYWGFRPDTRVWHRSGPWAVDQERPMPADYLLPQTRPQAKVAKVD